MPAAVAYALVRAAPTLVSSHGLSAQRKCREESLDGTHELRCTSAYATAISLVTKKRLVTHQGTNRLLQILTSQNQMRMPWREPLV
jgi:hypothetical protein